MIEIQWNPQRRFLRWFAVLFVVFFAILGAIQYYRSEELPLAIICWVGGGVIGTIGYFAPGFMRAVYLGWMIAVFPIGWLVSHLLLACVFYLAILPTGLIMKLCGNDPMQRDFDRDAKTYWQARSGRRSPRRYFRQFRQMDFYSYLKIKQFSEVE